MFEQGSLKIEIFKQHSVTRTLNILTSKSHFGKFKITKTLFQKSFWHSLTNPGRILDRDCFLQYASYPTGSFTSAYALFDSIRCANASQDLRQKFFCAFFLRRIKKFIRGRSFYNDATVHKYNPIGHFPCKSHFMRYRYHGHSRSG